MILEEEEGEGVGVFNQVQNTTLSYIHVCIWKWYSVIFQERN